MLGWLKGVSNNAPRYNARICLFFLLQSLYPDSPALFAPRVSQKTTPEPRGIKDSVARSIPTLCSADLIINFHIKRMLQ